MLLHTGCFFLTFVLLEVLVEHWVQIESIVFMYLIHRWLVVVWCGWPHSICVWVCAHLHLCTCVVLGANDSWHLATISGSLISIERFGGEAQIFLHLTNRCVFDLLTQLTHTLRCTRCPSSLTYGNVYNQVPLGTVILTALHLTTEKHQEKIWIIVKSVVSLYKPKWMQQKYQQRCTMSSIVQVQTSQKLAQI